MPARLIPCALLALALFTTGAVGQKPAPKGKAKAKAKETLGDKVVEYSKGQMGEQVGGGECATWRRRP